MVKSYEIQVIVVWYHKGVFQTNGFILLGTDPDKNHFNAGEYLGCCIFLPLVLGEIICHLCSTLQRGRSCITN